MGSLATPETQGAAGRACLDGQRTRLTCQSEYSEVELAGLPKGDPGDPGVLQGPIDAWSGMAVHPGASQKSLGGLSRGMAWAREYSRNSGLHNGRSDVSLAAFAAAIITKDSSTPGNSGVSQTISCLPSGCVTRRPVSAINEGTPAIMAFCSGVSGSPSWSAYVRLSGPASIDTPTTVNAATMNPTAPSQDRLNPKTLCLLSSAVRSLLSGPS